MKLLFNKPRSPNYIKTDKGTFAIEDLTQEEVEEFIKTLNESVRDNYKLRQYRKGKR